ncbi:MAG: ABC transporter ATP-binding protein/permease [Verrucomicrobia bacterium]|nr:ABC transporter ATP-binding protein/permease [Verrucomicrobiota bacterium]
MRPRSLLGVLTFLGRYPGQVALCVMLLLGVIAIEMILPQILGEAINGLRQHVQLGVPFAPSVYATLFVALALVRAGLGFLLGPVRNRLVQQALGDLRAALYDAIQRLAFQYHDRANTGELISRSTTDVWRLQDFFFACLFLSFDIAASLVATVWLIFAVSTTLGWITLLTIVPTVGLIGFYASKLQPQWRNVHDLHGAMTAVVQENIAGVRVVKAFARENSEIFKFRGRKEIFLNALLDTVNYWAARVPFAQFVFGLSLPLILWAGGRQVIGGQLQIGDLAKVVFYLMAIGHRVGAVGQFTNIVQTASASAERILEVIHEPQVIRTGRRRFPAGNGAVEFDQVGFQYRAGPASIADVTFRVEPGQTVAIVGPTGSGKTTLVNLIPRFYDVTRGRVRIEGVDVRELDLRALRNSVSVIFQETFLFSATVAENIAYGRPQAGRAEIEECARLAQAHEFIAELPDGYHTVVGERGVTLSGGQKQRIAIARAFLMNPRILILDDATASVDARTERLIREGLRRLCRGRTTFVIAHRHSTVQHADWILVLKAGRVVERGSHSQLLGAGGFYAAIVAQQLQPAADVLSPS